MKPMILMREMPHPKTPWNSRRRKPAFLVRWPLHLRHLPKSSPRKQGDAPEIVPIVRRITGTAMAAGITATATTGAANSAATAVVMVNVTGIEKSNNFDIFKGINGFGNGHFI